jgi:hypothetical protein
VLRHSHAMSDVEKTANGRAESPVLAYDPGSWAVTRLARTCGAVLGEPVPSIVTPNETLHRRSCWCLVRGVSLESTDLLLKQCSSSSILMFVSTP